ncbi:hypothetical protein IYZ83_003070 [Wolbachia pipientis]|uniref:hypothetical protein n=1 Tax=Wolbachia pipientis TaxID=955 RepID=UPI001F15F541|nr:hypothetical protein [Wolbachia pipientis]UIP91155.1 hypothetical protein IYZ83_003070 [Wolbachia pipientis]
MGLNYHNLKKHRRNFLDITGLNFKIRFFFEIYYHENSNFPFAAGLILFLNVFT